jgi:D-methionine transport system ATP-binding protein
MIELKNLSKTFHTANGDIHALKNINLTIADGEIFGIIGLSGAGKSTLVRCINLLERPTEGNVFIDGQDITLLPTKELLAVRKNIGMIFQSFNLLAQRNILKNVCYPLEIAGIKKAEAKKRAMELLELVGLADRAKAYPAQLSGGQKQRVAIARALATNPKYLLCDEATSALDPNTTQAILDLLKKINREFGVTIIVITHEMKVIDSICDKVAVIDKSMIAETGKVSDVFVNPKSEIARGLILPKSRVTDRVEGSQMLRITFDGEESGMPVISNLVISSGVAVNIMYADTKDIDGKAYGQMLLQIPEGSHNIERVTAYLDSINLSYSKEV